MDINNDFISPVFPYPPNFSLRTGTTDKTTLPVRSATPDLVMFNDDEITANAEIITDLLFEDIGGQELLMMSRYDTVNGQDVLYQPIANLNILREEFNPNNIVRLQQTSNTVFNNFPIKFEIKIPEVSNSGTGENVYLDDDGNLIIELINILSNEQVEVQITSSGTIYEAGI